MLRLDKYQTISIGIAGINPVSQIVVQIIKNNYTEPNIYYFDDDVSKIGKEFYGCNTLGSLDKIPTKINDQTINEVVICLGEKNLKKRKELFEHYQKEGVHLFTIQHDSAIISELSEIQDGNIISFGVIVGHNAIIENNCILWSGAVIEHAAKIGPHCYIGPNASISGFVEIGECTLIGTGAVILPEIKIGKNCQIGAGAVVTKNVVDNATVIGNPAKAIL